MRDDDVLDAGEKPFRGEAFIQALELGSGAAFQGLEPVVSAAPEPTNLPENPGFEETDQGVWMPQGTHRDAAGWTYSFAGPTNSYVWQERVFHDRPAFGLPEFHSGNGALRTYTDDNAHTMTAQDVEVAPKTAYAASVWVRAADLHGKGFGQNPDMSIAGIVAHESALKDGELLKIPQYQL